MGNLLIMDKTQLVTIIITAIVSVTAKEVIIWLVGLLKNTQSAKNIKVLISFAFNKTNRAVIYDLLALSFYATILVNFAIDKTSPNRLDILIAIGAVLASILMIIFLFLDVLKAISANKKT